MSRGLLKSALAETAFGFLYSEVGAAPTHLPMAFLCKVWSWLKREYCFGSNLWLWALEDAVQALFFRLNAEMLLSTLLPSNSILAYVRLSSLLAFGLFMDSGPGKSPIVPVTHLQPGRCAPIHAPVKANHA